MFYAFIIKKVQEVKELYNKGFLFTPSHLAEILRVSVPRTNNTKIIAIVHPLGYGEETMKVLNECIKIRLKINKTLKGISPVRFEQIIANLLKRMGFINLERVGGPGDKSVDIFAEKVIDEFGNTEKYAIQCKNYNPRNKVGSLEMQKFVTMLKTIHKADRGIFITTSSFTDEAKEIAKHFKITLIDGKSLKNYMEKYRISYDYDNE
jgi:restriction endonuclease Mrr